MINLNFSVAFFAGVISFFAPCVLPLLPAYIGYVTGVSVKDLKEKGYSAYRKQMIVSSLLYILGFSLVFVASGIAAAGISVFLRQHELAIQRVGGFIILVLGLEFAGLLKIPFLNSTKQFRLPAWVDRLGNVRSFVLGLIFAAAWTPCIGAILGSILALAATSGKVVEGGLLLFVYSLGISLPFLLVSFTLASAPKYLKFITKYIGIIATVSGIILAILGVLLLTDTYKYVNLWAFEFTEFLGWNTFVGNRV